PYIRGVDNQQQIVVHLEVQRPGIRWRRYERDRLWLFWIAHIDDGEAAAEDVTDIGRAAVDHDLDAIALATLIAMSEESDIAP
ncbi:MAG: hypothetical protein WA652_14035, partial [Xanthobacteraceae bacterium]